MRRSTCGVDTWLCRYGVGNKVSDIAIVRCVWPVLFEEYGWEVFPLAEDVFSFFFMKYLV